MINIIKYSLFFIVTICKLNSFAQSSHFKQLMSINYNDVYIGKNLSAEYGFPLDSQRRHLLNIGLKIHDNRPIFDNQYHLFKDRFYAETFVEHLGLNFNYNRVIYIEDLKIFPFFFAGVDLSYISMHGIARSSLESLPDGTPVFIESTYSTPPWLIIESRIGFGILFHITEYLFLKQNVGIGIGNFIPMEENSSVVIVTPQYWEVINTYCAGLVYTF